MTEPDCPLCERVAKKGSLFIADLGVSRAYFNEDQFFPGWVFVVLRRHAVELYELAPDERSALIEDVNRVAVALNRVYKPLKMNYELLGNQVPHMHWHLIPRLPGDPDLRGPVWRVNHTARQLTAEEVHSRILAIRESLGQSR